jgi:XTP/dITP diphosphohydrolase
MNLVFATNNPHKIQEVKQLLMTLPLLQILSLNDIGCYEELAETGNTLEENAMQKARYVFEKYHISCFADDTGLEIEALGGKPGVLSARYAGEDKNSENNIRKVLNEMKNNKNRIDRFRTVIALITNNKEYLFEGIVNGVISEQPRGKHGFGYDPIFIPDGSNKSYSEMSLEEKNKNSHRAIAVEKLAEFLNLHIFSTSTI